MFLVCWIQVSTHRWESLSRKHIINSTYCWSCTNYWSNSINIVYTHFIRYMNLYLRCDFILIKANLHSYITLFSLFHHLLILLKRCMWLEKFSPLHIFYLCIYLYVWLLSVITIQGRRVTLCKIKYVLAQNLVVCCTLQTSKADLSQSLLSFYYLSTTVFRNVAFVSLIGINKPIY